MIPSKEKVASALEKHFNVKLYPLSGKQIFFSGKMANGKEILVCTPKSKLCLATFQNKRTHISLIEQT